MNRVCAKSDRIVDLGAYTGALIARIRDNGFIDVTASDIVSHMADRDVNFVAADYNTDFASNFAGATFDCVIACEVIEHLDNPRRFLAQCAKLLSQNGVVIVSTPNIAFFAARIKFLLTGELWGYGANNYKIQRHISPISHEQFPLLFKECGFDMIQYETRGSFATLARKVETAPIWGRCALFLANMSSVKAALLSAGSRRRR